MILGRFRLTRSDLPSIALPIVVTAFWLVGLDTMYSFSPATGMFVRFLGRTLLLVAAITLSLLAIVRAFGGRPGTLIGVVGAVLIAWALDSSPFTAGDYVHLAAEYPGYRKQIGNASKQDPETISFHWGGTGFMGAGNSTRTLVHDPTGALSDQIGIHEAPGGIWVRTRHLIGSFYTVEQEW